MLIIAQRRSTTNIVQPNCVVGFHSTMHCETDSPSTTDAKRINIQALTLSLIICGCISRYAPFRADP